MKITVGTANPAKLAAVTTVARHYFPEAAVQGIDTPSGVSPMPQTDEEGVTGARNRAHACLAADPACELSIGLESTLCPTPWGLFLTCWCVVIDRQNQQVMASSPRTPVPPVLEAEVRQGQELRDLMQRHGLVYEHHRGMLGVLTHGAHTREQNLTDALYLALQAFTHPGLYNLNEKKIAV